MGESHELERALGLTFREDLVDRALAHPSYAHEEGGQSNEALAHLGDSVLGLVVTSALWKPDLTIGQMTDLRKKVVSNHVLADEARKLKLGTHLRLGKGAGGQGGRENTNNLATLLEALLGAVYLQYGFETAKRIIDMRFGPLIQGAAEAGPKA